MPLPDGTTLPLAVSAGVAHAPSDTGESGGLYSVADTNLYSAEREGRNRVGASAGVLT